MYCEILSGRWLISCGHILGVTILLNNWKTALSFAVAGRTVKPAHLVNLVTTGNAVTEGRTALPGFQSVHSVSGTVSTMRCALRCLLHCFVPSLWVPMAFRMLLPFPAGALNFASQTWGGRRVCSVTPCVHPAAKSLKPFLRRLLSLNVTNPAWQDLSVWGSFVRGQKLFVYLILIPCLHSRQWLCACVYSLTFMHITSYAHHMHAHILVPLGHCTFRWKNTCLCNMLLIFNQTH